MSVYTKKRDLPTYPEPPSGRYGTYLPTYPARPAITTAVTSMLCRYIILLSDALLLARAAGAGLNRLWADFALFFRARRLRFAAVCPHLFLLSLRAFIGSRRPLRRSHEHSTSHW